MENKISVECEEEGMAMRRTGDLPGNVELEYSVNDDKATLSMQLPLYKGEISNG